MSDDSDVTPSVAANVADQLRDAFVVLGSASITAEQRATFQRRLLAITTASKRDVRRAREQLERFHEDLRAAEATTDSSEDD